MLSDNWMSEFPLNPSFSNCTILSSVMKDSLPLFNSLYWFLWWLTNQTSFRILAYFWGTSQYPHCCLNSIRYENYSFQEMPSVDCFSEFHLNPSFYNCAILSSLMKKTPLFFNSIYWLLWISPIDRDLGSLHVFEEHYSAHNDAWTWLTLKAAHSRPC